MFLPFYICLFIWSILSIVLLLKGSLIKSYTKIPKSKYILLFSFISFCVSFYYQNYIGLLCTIICLCVLSLIIYYMDHVTLCLFENIIDIMLFMSILCAVYGVFEYIGILNSIGIDGFELIVLNEPHERLNSVFFNANYYATMIEFFVMMAVYKLLTSRERIKIIYYFCIIIINLFLLYLTGCRTAWPAIGIGILTFLLFDQRYSSFKLVSLLVIVGLIIFLIYPQIFPRTSNILEYFGVRKGIWDVSVQAIKDHIWFGEGPLTYMHIYQQYGGVYTQHAHSLYLDPILSYGIIGLAALVPVVSFNLKSFITVYKQKYNRSLTALIIGSIIIVLIHGIMDYTVYFVQTGFCFLMLIYSYFIYCK